MELDVISIAVMGDAWKLSDDMTEGEQVEGE